MTENEAIKSLKNNNELCLNNCEGECGSYKDGKCYCADALVVSALEEYIAIGTVEECRAAVEKQRAKKPILSAPCKSINYYLCLNCGKILPINKPFCSECGSAVDWSDTP